MARYLSDKQLNEPATSNDWNRMIAQLSQLEQIASGELRPHEVKAVATEQHGSGGDADFMGPASVQEAL